MKIINNTKYPDETILGWQALGLEFIKTAGINPRLLIWASLEIGMALSGLKIHAPLNTTLSLFPLVEADSQGIFVNWIGDELHLDNQ